MGKSTVLNLLARKIIDNNQYMTIACANNDDTWISPVAYAQDSDYTLYFVSIPSSKHISYIMRNKKATVAIYDSHQEWGSGIGLQIEGDVSEVPLSELPHALTSYFTRDNPYGRITDAYGKALKNLLNRKLYKMYQFTPSTVWINNPNSEIDERIEVEIKNSQ